MAVFQVSMYGRFWVSTEAPEARTRTGKCLRCSAGSWPAPLHSTSNIQSLSSIARASVAAACLSANNRLRSSSRGYVTPLFPFLTHFGCVAERWADTGADDRAPRPIAEANDATTSASERTST